jgi:hypothetical protein
MYTADVYCRSYQTWKYNGLRRPFMTVLDGRNFGKNARKILRS